MKPFENQVAIVTGAGRGIGEAIAKRFAEKGAKLAVVSRTELNSQKTADAINALSPDAAKPYSVDVADYDAVQKIGEKILADFGRCDVLVNNAGVTRDTLIMRMGSEDWDVVLDTNLKGAFNFIRAILRPMVKQRKGRIINSARSAGLWDSPARRTTPPARPVSWDLPRRWRASSRAGISPRTSWRRDLSKRI